MIRQLSRHSDVALAVAIVAAVAILVVPLPTGLVDVLLAGSIAGAVILLLSATWVRHPIRLSALPAILLLATLFRLSLNVSTTRLILSEADAGSVIDAFGGFVTAGNTLVGAVIFVILTVVQYVVIAKGAERVAEVSARFTLDALPGRQLAIDADLRSGAIDLERARGLRAELARESRLYSALDGAMKFVKGDAIAGIVITLVNIGAGLAVGVLQQGMALGDAVRVYTLLTIGDGLAAQIPAILTATAAAVVVTQVAGEGERGNLARDIGRQLSAYPRALAVSAGLLLVFALLPGLPLAPFLILGLSVGALAWGVRRRGEEGPSGVLGEVADSQVRPRLWLRVGAGPGRAEAVLRAELREAVGELRVEIQGEWGVTLPEVGVEVVSSPPRVGWDIELELDGAPLLRASLDDSGAGLVAWAMGVARRGLRAQLPLLLGVQAVAERVDGLAASQPALVEAVVPSLLDLPALTELLRQLLAEGVPVVDLARVLEVVAREGSSVPSRSALLERVRQGLGRHITARWADASGVVRGLVVAREIEEMIRSGVRQTALGPRLGLERDIREIIVDAVAAAVGGADLERPLMITRPDVRPHLWRLLREGSGGWSSTSSGALVKGEAAVLSFEELVGAARVEAVGTVERRGSSRSGASMNDAPVIEK